MRQSLVPCSPSRNKILFILAKNYAKLDLKVICSCAILFDFFNLSYWFFLIFWRLLQSVVQELRDLYLLAQQLENTASNLLN